MSTNTNMQTRKENVFKAENILSSVAASLITMTAEEIQMLNLDPAQVAELINAAIAADQAACTLRHLIHAAQPA